MTQLAGYWMVHEFTIHEKKGEECKRSFMCALLGID